MANVYTSVLLIIIILMYICHFVDQQHPISGLNGGTFWDRSRQNEQQSANDPKAEIAPKCIRLKQKNGRDYQDEMIVMRVSNDGVLGGIYV